MSARPHKKDHYGKAREMHFDTAGMTFRLTSDRQHELEEELPVKVVLTREPDNVQDRNAVAIHLAEYKPGMHIGFVPKAIAAKLAPLMDAGEIRFTEAWLVDMGEHNGRMRIVFQKKSSKAA